MAKLFAITLPQGSLASVKLDSQGRASVQYTVLNVSARPIDGRAKLTAVPPADPPDPTHPVQKGWIRLQDNPEYHFDTGKDKTFTVLIAVPPKSPAGTYSYRLDVVSVAKPDEGDSSPPLSFTVVQTAPPPPKWGLIAAIIAVVVIAAGVGLWLALRKKTPAVPNLVGMTVANATAALSANNLQLDPHMDLVIGQPTSSGLVLAQTPPAGPIPQGTTSVHVQVGAATVDVPNVIGHTLADASTNILSPLQLSIGTATPQASAGTPPGTITAQTPAVGTPVQTNSTISVTITPQVVNVPSNLVGMTLNSAANAVLTAGLVPGPITGDGSNVTATNPSPGSPVPAGSTVSFTTPSSLSCRPPCIFRGPIARLRYQPALTAKALQLQAR